MKIYIETPGGCVRIERQPMAEQRFRAVCGIVSGALFLAALVAALYLVGPLALVALVPALVVVLVLVALAD